MKFAFLLTILSRSLPCIKERRFDMQNHGVAAVLATSILPGTLNVKFEHTKITIITTSTTNNNTNNSMNYYYRLYYIYICIFSCVRSCVLCLVGVLKSCVATQFVRNYSYIAVRICIHMVCSLFLCRFSCMV